MHGSGVLGQAENRERKAQATSVQLASSSLLQHSWGFLTFLSRPHQTSRSREPVTRAWLDLSTLSPCGSALLALPALGPPPGRCSCPGPPPAGCHPRAPAWSRFHCGLRPQVRHPRCAPGAGPCFICAGRFAPSPHLQCLLFHPPRTLKNRTLQAV